MFPPKPLYIVPPEGGCSEGLDAFRFFLNNTLKMEPTTTTVDPMLFPSGNPFKCHEEVLYLQPFIQPKHFDIFPLGDSQKV